MNQLEEKKIMNSLHHMVEVGKLSRTKKVSFRVNRENYDKIKNTGINMTYFFNLVLDSKVKQMEKRSNEKKS